jgi:hypothetical protein
MSYHVIDNGIIGGEQINPPEYAPDNPVECAVCGAEWDEEDVFRRFTPYGDCAYRTEAGIVCHDCLPKCERCGEALHIPPLMDGLRAMGDWWCEYCFADELCGGLEM